MASAYVTPSFVATGLVMVLMLLLVVLASSPRLGGRIHRNFKQLFCGESDNSALTSAERDE